MLAILELSCAEKVMRLPYLLITSLKTNSNIEELKTPMDRLLMVELMEV
jgi:hypothetical protein